MITDTQTNFLYISDKLHLQYNSFQSFFNEALEACGIEYGYIPFTNDVWAVDYMPVQVTENKFVQFVYNPDYLQGAKKWQESISDVNRICAAMQLDTIKSSIVLDGGNVVRSQNKVILCNKVFKENPSLPEKQLIKKLEDLFEVDTIIFVPQQPGDIIGHADGMVRFLDDSTVLINDYSRESKEFQINFRSALHNAGLSFIEVPYNPYTNRTDLQAVGIYINYLHMQQGIILPVYGLEEDEKTVYLFEEIFDTQKVTTVYSSELARQGGVLNCVSWNIWKHPI